MTRPSQLPESSFVPVITRRLARPVLLWQDERAAALGFDAERIFAIPVATESPATYVDKTRVQWADRYGGVGTGTAGGSGRCATSGDLQTKGVGVTALVAHDGDEHHSSGTQTVLGALAETVFAGVFEAALPFGALPTVAAVLTRSTEGRVDPMAPARALTFRPFVLRPAHFMRNVFNREQRVAQGAEAPGWTRDAYRVSQALQHLARGFQTSLGLPYANDIETIDAGLRELNRRLAWQFAANFSKRLPHGSVSCSNFSLSGQFLDFGNSQSLPTYRRPADALQDPWTECERARHTLVLMRQQLDKYYPGLRGANVVSAEELSSAFTTTMEQRLRIEMAKMAGLTEDLAASCAPALLTNWLTTMRDVWRRGGLEPLIAPDPSDGAYTAAINPRRPDLNRVFVAAAPHTDAEAMDQAVRPLVADQHLRYHFVAATVAVRRALGSRLGGLAGALDAYLSMQARRKNAVLHDQERDSWFRISVVTRMQEEGFDPSAVQARLTATLERARFTLADVTPGLPGATGVEQLQALSTA